MSIRNYPIPVARDEANEHNATYAEHSGVINPVELLGAFGDFGRDIIESKAERGSDGVADDVGYVRDPDCEQVLQRLGANAYRKCGDQEQRTAALALASHRKQEAERGEKHRVDNNILFNCVDVFRAAERDEIKCTHPAADIKKLARRDQLKKQRLQQQDGIDHAGDCQNRVLHTVPVSRFQIDQLLVVDVIFSKNNISYMLVNINSNCKFKYRFDTISLKNVKSP